MRRACASCLLFTIFIPVIGCKETETKGGSVTAHRSTATPKTCTEVAPHIVLVHEDQLYIPGTDSDKVANGGAYAKVAVDECTEQAWSVEVRACLDAALGDRSQTDACVRILDPKARARLATAFARVESTMPGFRGPPTAMPWLAP